MLKRAYVGRVTKICETCGVAVTRKNSEFRAHVFCSRRCHFSSAWFAEIRRVSNAERSARAVRPCQHCGTSIERAVSQFNRLVFRSRACQRAYSLANPVRQVGHILEHRKVMQDRLGRPLSADENVHHRNGDRTDNRLVNLELWSRSQPPGQRVEDKIAWAREFLAFYT